MQGSRRRIWWTALILLPGSIMLSLRHWPATANHEAPIGPAPLKLQISAGMIHLPGGSFNMGSLQTQDDDAQPLHQVHIGPFWLDATPVTNEQFEQFVEATEYQTDAERRGSSLVFDRQQAVWREVVGVNWRHPDSPDSSLAGKALHPVVHVTWQDAATFAVWAKKRLPTEAEYEYAARGGLNDCWYPWGRKFMLGERHMANSWQGHFPDQDRGIDGFRGTSPVAHFPPNRFGLYDMAGNVWNWCADWYGSNYYGASLKYNPQGPTSGSERVLRGGSWLSTQQYEGGLCVAYRHHAPPRQSTNHTGFRCARDE